MCTVFTKTAIGASHLKDRRPCQDHSACYRDEEKTIVTVCDGHGGATYIRSHKGSRFASAALISALQKVDQTAFRKRKDDLTETLRIRIITEWNALVAQDLAAHPIKRCETERLSDRQKEMLKRDPYKAYGTTAHGACLTGNKLICVSLGDGGFFFLKNRQITPAFEEDDEQAANLTHSLCEEDASRFLHVSVADARTVDGVLLCSDGVVNPYGNLDNFRRSFVLPALRSLANAKPNELSEFIVSLGETKGTGDDVSIAVLFKERVVKKYGKRCAK